ncbi:MAG: hypothetical protein RJQ14_13160, partial [Marinoscillum sp.]
MAQETEGRWSYLFDQSDKKGLRNGEMNYYLLEGDHILIQQISNERIIPVRRLSATKWVVSIPDTATVKEHNAQLKRVNNLWKLSDNIFNLKERKKLSF